MGGDHHGHGHKIKIPDYSIYKTEAVPELMATRRALAAKGLTDPWLRNEVWKYNREMRGTTKQIMRRTIGRGMFWGFVAAVITTAAGKLMDRMDDGHGESNNAHHH